MIGTAFKVLTEFKFEVGSAIASSNQLQGAVGQLSGAADSALLSFQRLGFGIAAQFGLGSGGLLGMFYKGIQASDKFYQAQLKISNILQSNRLFEGANAFEESMRASEVALNNINASAKQFSLPVMDLANLSTQVGAVLTVKKLDDATLSKSIDISRQFLKSAPILGVDPGLATQQLVGAISGRAELGSTLIQRLIDETSAMQKFGGQGGLKKFNAMEPAKRLEILTQALAQFSSNAKVTDAIAKSMSGQLRRLNDNLMSMFSILRPIGDALMAPIRMILETVNNYLEREGLQTIKNIAPIIERLFANPEALYVTLQQISRLKRDLTGAGKTLAGLEILGGLLFVLGFVGIRAAGVMGLLGMAFRKLMTIIGPFLGPVLGVAFRVLSFAITRVLPPLMAMVFLFQTISRALAIADVSNAKWLANNMPKITELIARLQRAISLIFLPVTMAMDGLAQLLAWVVRLDISGNILIDFLSGFATALSDVGMVVVHALSLISGAMNALAVQTFSLFEGNFKQLFQGDEWSRLADEGYNEFWNRFMKDPVGGAEQENPVSNKVTNIDKIEIVNQFKEQMEPDRIAFSLKEQLIKAATNPQQAAGRSMRANAIGN